MHKLFYLKVKLRAEVCRTPTIYYVQHFIFVNYLNGYETIFLFHCLGKPNNYENWQAHNGECVLGSKTIYKRRVQGSTCQNSADQLDLNKAEFQPCTCQLHDFSWFVLFNEANIF